MSDARNLVDRLRHWAEHKPDAPSIHGRRGQDWYSLTWSEYWTAARETAKGLIALGHEPGDCVAIVGANRPEWVICQFGIMAAGGVPAPSYPTNTVEQVAHILKNSECDIAIADTKDLVDQYRRALETDPDLEVPHLIAMLDGEDDDAMSLEALRALGREQADDELDTRLDAAKDTDTALLIYTSGTTGVSKGVMLDGGALVQVADSVMAHLPNLDKENYRVVSYLPLCHIAEQVMTNVAHMHTGGEVYFCPDLSQIKDYLVKVRPTVFAAVPRVWEKFQAALEARLGEATGIKAKLAAWARRTEQAAIERELETRRPVSSLSRTLANKLVISKIQEGLGLEELQVASTAAAPISMDTLRFFASIGLVVSEWYGMSETTGLVTGNPQNRVKFGTVGKPIDGVEVKIAQDGEILARGRTMTTGYLRMPEQTAELIDDEGWLHTGDLGALDDDGYLRITGRKKDILITAGGKNVAPAEMEALISPIPGIGQVVVVGDRMPYLSALVTFDPENLSAFAELSNGKPTFESLANNDAVKDFLQAQIEERCNAKVARYQTIKRIRTLPIEFSVEGGELTPTMKVKRNVVVEKYADEIEQLYA